MNGLVEQRNGQLKEISRKLLIQADLGREFWGHSIMKACYLQNRMASKHSNGRTPHEVMFNMTPSVSHLHVFGGMCYPLIQKKQRDPYRHKATCDVGIFIRYDRQSCGYLVYIPSKKRVFVRYDC